MMIRSQFGNPVSRCILCKYLRNTDSLAIFRYQSDKLPINSDKGLAKSWVTKKGVIPDLKVPGKVRPTTYSDRMVKRFFDFPDSPINDVVLNFFMGKCVYDHCFPYHTHYKRDYLQFLQKLQATSDYLARSGSNKSKEDFFTDLKMCGMLGILTKTEVGGLGIDQRREFLRLCETIIDYTHNVLVIRDFLITNSLQLCVDTYVENKEVAENIQKLFNEGVKANLVVFDDAEIVKQSDRWIVVTNEAAPLGAMSSDMKNSGILICLARSRSSDTEHILLLPTTGNEGIEFAEDFSSVSLKSCTISSALVVSEGENFLKTFETIFRLAQSAIIASWFKHVANQVLLDISRRRRFGYRMNKFQNIILQIEEIEQLCYTIETLPYFSASRMDRARNLFNQEPPEMHTEVCSVHLQLHRLCRKLSHKLLLLAGPDLLYKPNFIKLTDFINNSAFQDIKTCEDLIVKEGMELHKQCLTEKDLQRPLRLRLRQLKFNYFNKANFKQVETSMSDWYMLFVHQNFQHIANDTDKQIFNLLRILNEAKKYYPNNYENNSFVRAIAKDVALNLHTMVALMARTSQSIFKGNRFSLHENRIVEKYLSDLVSTNFATNKKWTTNAPFETSIKTAEEFDENKSVLQWTKYPLN